MFKDIVNAVASAVDWESRVVKKVKVANGDVFWTEWNVRRGQMQEQSSKWR